MIEVDSRGPRIQMATSLRSAVVYLAQFLVKSCWYSCSRASRSVAWKSPKEWQELLQHSPHSCWPRRGTSQKLRDLICLVAGQYGDVSQDFHHLLKSLATSKATHTQRAILFVTQSEVYSSTNSQYFRVIIYQINHLKQHIEIPTQFLAQMKDFNILLTKKVQKVIFGMGHLPKNCLF